MRRLGTIAYRVVIADRDVTSYVIEKPRSDKDPYTIDLELPRPDELLPLNTPLDMDLELWYLRPGEEPIRMDKAVTLTTATLRGKGTLTITDAIKLG